MSFGKRGSNSSEIKCWTIPIKFLQIKSPREAGTECAGSRGRCYAKGVLGVKETSMR